MLRCGIKDFFWSLLDGPQWPSYEEACAIAQAFGFRLSRIKGSHHVFAHESIPELVNLQDVSGKAKPHQIRQLLRLIERYNLSIGGEE